MNPLLSQGLMDHEVVTTISQLLEDKDLFKQRVIPALSVEFDQTSRNSR